MNKLGGKKKPKFSVQNLEEIPGQVAYMVCKGNTIVHSTFPDSDNPRQIAYNAMRMATRTKGSELGELAVHTIHVQYDDFHFEMFQIAGYYCIVKKKSK